MPRILIDVTRLLYRRVRRTLPTGIDRVGLAYVRHYGAQASAVLSLGAFSVVLSRRDSAAVFRALAGNDVPVRALALVVVTKAFLWRWMAGNVGGALLFHTSHSGLENPHYGWSLRRRGARVIVFVHDLIPILHAGFCGPGVSGLHASRMLCAARVSAGIVTNSNCTLAAFDDFCRLQGVSRPPAVAAHLGEGLPKLAPRERPLPQPYFVVLGTIEARKNHAMLLQVWQQLAATLGQGAPRLVLIGQRGWESGNAMEVLERYQPLRGIVTWKSRCGDEELVTWLTHARALLFPSFVEGYGLPLGEALSRGVPVIASDLPVFREIAGDIPEYADPHDGARWAALVEDYAREDSALRATQAGRLRAFRPATWEGHFAQVDGLLAGLP